MIICIRLKYRTSVVLELRNPILAEYDSYMLPFDDLLVGQPRLLEVDNPFGYQQTYAYVF